MGLTLNFISFLIYTQAKAFISPIGNLLWSTSVWQCLGSRHATHNVNVKAGNYLPPPSAHTFTADFCHVAGAMQGMKPRTTEFSALHATAMPWTPTKSVNVNYQSYPHLPTFMIYTPGKFNRPALIISVIISQPIHTPHLWGSAIKAAAHISISHNVLLHAQVKMNTKVCH